MNLNNYQKNPVKLKNSVKYDYRYKYCPPYIKGINNTYQYYNGKVFQDIVVGK